jgi:uncharacterized protein (TIGR00251 family)
MTLPFRLGRDGATLAVRVTLKAVRDRVIGLSDAASGGVALKLAVHAPPRDGEANDALIRLLASHFGLRRGDLRVASGAGSRHKLVHIVGDPAKIGSRLEQGLKPWLKHG